MLVEHASKELYDDWVPGLPEDIGTFVVWPRGSSYLIIKALGLKDHYYYRIWDLIP